MGAAHTILRRESGGLSSGRLKKRIAEVAHNVPAADAVSQAVAAMSAALITTTVIVPVIIAGS